MISPLKITPPGNFDYDQIKNGQKRPQKCGHCVTSAGIKPLAFEGKTRRPENDIVG